MKEISGKKKIIYSLLAVMWLLSILIYIKGSDYSAAFWCFLAGVWFAEGLTTKIFMSRYRTLCDDMMETLDGIVDQVKKAEADKNIKK